MAFYRDCFTLFPPDIGWSKMIWITFRQDGVEITFGKHLRTCVWLRMGLAYITEWIQVKCTIAIHNYVIWSTGCWLYRVNIHYILDHILSAIDEFNFNIFNIHRSGVKRKRKPSPVDCNHSHFIQTTLGSSFSKVTKKCIMDLTPAPSPERTAVCDQKENTIC